MASNKKIKKGQSLSADILVVMVIVFFGILFVVLNQINKLESSEDLNLIREQAAYESDLLFNKLKTNQVLNSKNEIDAERLLNMNHEQIREELGIGSDFAIVFEKNGNLIKIDPENEINCIGSSEILVNGIPCR